MSSKISKKKKELLERKIGGKKQNTLSPTGYLPICGMKLYLIQGNWKLMHAK